MTDEPLPQDPGADEALAMDYAIGGLDRDARRAVEARLRADPAFRAMVEAWQVRLAPLDEATAPLAPPPEIWGRISAEIAPVRPPAPVRGGLWYSLALWRGLAVAGVAAAVIAITQPPPPVPGAPPPLLVAALAGADGTPLLAAAYDPLRRAVVLTPATQRDDAGKSPELWVIEGSAAPRSLGVIDIKGPNAHVISPERLAGLHPGAVLAITIEPLGGAPGGVPTGPVVASGTLRAI